jgi:uncharacterized membrane protein YdjX (TVP38/TMEM64 family)
VRTVPPVPPEPTPSVATQPSLLSRLGPAGLLGVGALALPPLGGIALITYMGTVSEWLRSHAGSGVFIYAACFVVLAGLALLPTYAQAALGGYAFGWAVGLPAALVGFVGGAWVGYEIARRASGERVEKVVAEKPKWQAIRDALVRDREARSFWKTTGMVALLRCPPNSPFALTNLVMASVKVPRRPFLLGTLIGMTPRTAAAVAIGSTVERFTRENLEQAAPKWIWIAGLGITLAVVVIVAAIADRAVKRLTAGVDPAGAKAPPAPPPAR